MTRDRRRPAPRALLAALFLHACAEVPTESAPGGPVHAKAPGTVTVTAAVPDVAQQGESLRSEVARFLDNIRAA